MPLKLKNAGTTYQRLVNKMFALQIKWNVEVYIDNMLVKSTREISHLNDLWETFETLHLRNGMLPEDRNASHRLKVQSLRFVLIGDVLYKEGFSHPYMRCLAPTEANYVMREVHERVCGNHSGAHLPF